MVERRHGHRSQHDPCRSFSRLISMSRCGTAAFPSRPVRKAVIAEEEQSRRFNRLACR